MKNIKFIILFIIIMFATGCWNYRELNELSIVSAIGIDVIEDEFLITIDIVNARKVASNAQSGGSSSEESPTVLYTYKSKSMKEAINNMVLEAPNQLYTGHLNLLVIGEEAAKKGIYEFIDYFMTDTEIRKNFPVIIVENGTALDALKIVLPIDIVSTKNISNSLEVNARFTSYLSNRKFDEVLNCLYMEGRHITISSVKIIGSPEEGKKMDNISNTFPENSIKITGSAIFKKDKLVGYIYNLDSLGYNILRGLSKTTAIKFPCDKNNNYGTVVVDEIKAKIKSTIKDNKPFYKITVTGKASLPEFNCKTDNDFKGFVEEAEKMANKEVKKILTNTITVLQKDFASDVIGFGELLYKNHYKYWQKVKDDWDENGFLNIKYEINSKIPIESIDSTIKPAKEAK